MSGHSKWHTIKHKKGATDAKRGKIFTKLIKEITVAARTGGSGDIDSNARLRKAVTDAKGQNMPNDTIDRAIKRGTGELEGAQYDEVLYEGYGPNGVAVMVEAMTDNRNRTVAEIRHIFSKNGGNMGESGSVGWMFDKKGYFVVDKAAKSEDELFEIAIDAGADDDVPEAVDPRGQAGRDHRGRQRPEAGRHAVHGVLTTGQILDDRRAAGNGLYCGVGERHPGPVTSDRDHVGGADTARTDHDIANRGFHQTQT